MIRFGGFLSCSLSDYPGSVSAVVFTQGCNFRCPFCHNAGLMPLDPQNDRTMRSAEILARLGGLRGKIDSVVITGGEPLIHEDLLEFLESVRALGLKIKLDTNGSFPERLERVLERNLADFIAMDIKAPRSKYNDLCGVKCDLDRIEKSRNLIASGDLAHQFRTTFVRPLLSGADIEEIRNGIPFGSPYRVQTFRSENAFDPSLRRKI